MTDEQASSSIGRWSGEFEDPELEGRFLSEVFPALRARARAGLIIAWVLWLVFGLVYDPLTLPVSDVMNLVPLRVVAVLVGLPAVLRVHTVASLRRRLLVAILSVVVAWVAMEYLHPLRHPDRLDHAGLFLLIVGFLGVLSTAQLMLVLVALGGGMLGATVGAGDTPLSAVVGGSMFFLLTAFAAFLGTRGQSVVLRQRQIDKWGVDELLHTSQELLRTREELIGELAAFTHTAAHDLKSPLSTLLWSIHAESSGPDGPSPNLARMEGVVLKMGEIVDGLLLLARVREREDVPLGPLTMDAIVGSCLLRIEAEIEESAALIELPDTWPVVRGFGPWIEEVWANYLSNALKYGGTPPRVRLGWEQAGSNVRFFVADRGPGVGTRTEEELFRAFESHGKLGHGIGLSIVKRIMDRLEGDVGVKPADGGGARFWFSLPLDGSITSE